MSDKRIRKVVITGGGTAGWVAACALTHQFRELLDITLVESEQIGTVGVGESTIPTIRTFHKLLQIDEREFLSSVAGSFKLAISFENWKHPGDHYFHPFGTTGMNTWSCDFHQFWLRDRNAGSTHPIQRYSLCAIAAKQDKFTLPVGLRPEQEFPGRSLAQSWTGAADPSQPDTVLAQVPWARHGARLHRVRAAWRRRPVRALGYVHGRTDDRAAHSAPAR